MKYCEKCKVTITDKKTHCPLCQRVLSGNDENQIDTFPFVSTIYKQYSFLFKLIMFISISCGVITVAINIMLPQKGWWSLFVVGGIMCLWISIYTIIHKRTNPLKTIMYQLMLVSILSVIWDVFTKWHGWSLDYVIPIICVSAMLAMGIISKIMKVQIDDYIIYLIINSFFGIIPIVFLLTGLLNVLYPTLICIVASIISFTALLIFEGESMKMELKKRLHL